MQRDDDAVNAATDRGAGPLSGIKVLDFTRMLVGPIATMLLADLGADVIKIEPEEGDALRHMQDGDDAERSAFFISANRNKRDLLLDLGAAESRPTVHALVRQADVVVHNFMPQLEDKFGLGYDALKSIRPDLVYCSIGAWGGAEAGWARRPGTDVLFQAASGLMSVTGERAGRSMRAGAPIIDVTTGVTAAFAILAGLRHRDLTGEGVEVGTSLYEQALFAQSPLLAWTSQGGANPPRLGNQSPMALILELPCRDGDLVVSIPTEKMWQRLCTALDASELRDNPQYSSSTDRLGHQAEIAEVVAAQASHRTVAELSAVLVAGGVPFAPVHDYLGALATIGEITGRDLLEVSGDRFGRLDVIPSPVRSSAWTTTARLPSPALGQHTEQILRYRDSWGKPPTAFEEST